MEIDLSLLSENASILIVDDTIANLSLLARMLKDCGYQARPVPNGRLALQAAKNQKPDLVLLDITMPEMDGYEVCTRFKQDPDLREVPVIFISALSQTEEKVRAFNTGGVDYITKPFQFEEVKARVETHLKLHRLQVSLEDQVANQVKEISDLQMGMIFGLAKLAEARDTDTGSHLERIQLLCRMLGEELLRNREFDTEINQQYCDRLFHASPLHDIGKVGIPDSVLLKPGRLTGEEFEVMKTHTTIGAKTLKEVQNKFPNNEFIQMGVKIARSHHERWDGKGYPEGISGVEIPLCARIMAIVDVYDAIRSKRIYKPPITHIETCEIINRENGTHFEPVIVTAFNRLASRFNDVWTQLPN
jgi:putative two-component system response regulator